MTRRLPRAFGLLHRLARDESGVQLIEFAYALPIWILLLLGGAEITNYTTTRMRISQIALNVADNAARIGSGSLLAAKTISETQINDVLTGGGLQGGDLDLYNKGRVIISDLETDPANTGKYRIRWQRCRGTLTHTSQYGSAGDVNLTGIGPASQQVTTPADSATMFVEVRYTYTPIIAVRWAPAMTITEVASMTVRDRRDLTGGPSSNGIYNTEGATVNSCTRYTAT